MLRSAPVMDMAAVCESVGVGCRESLRDLARISRGRCGQLAASLATPPDSVGADAAAKHRACPPGAVRAAKAQAAGTSAWTARHVTRSVTKAGSVTWSPEPGLPRRVAARLVLAQQRPHKPSVSLAQLADHKSCPPAILVSLSGTDPSVAARLASSMACPPAAMSGLACSHDSVLRSVVARNERCPGVVVEALAADDDRMVRAQAAANWSCPPGLLERRLCADEDASVRERVAANLASRPEVLDRLASDLGFVARHAVSNPCCPTGVLQRCVSDPRPEVRREALSAIESRAGTLAADAADAGSDCVWLAALSVHLNCHPTASRGAVQSSLTAACPRQTGRAQNLPGRLVWMAAAYAFIS